VPAAEGVRRIAANRDDLVAARADLDAAERFAQVASAVAVTV